MRVTLIEEARMRGDDRQQAAMWSYVSPEARVPQAHPLRPIRQMVDAALNEPSPQFAALYAATGRPSIAPEKLLRALLLQVLYTVRSERLLMEQLDYNLLFRWFVGLEMDDPVRDHSVFTKNRERLLAGDIAQAFFEQVLAQARQGHLGCLPTKPGQVHDLFTPDNGHFEYYAAPRRRRSPNSRASSPSMSSRLATTAPTAPGSNSASSPTTSPGASSSTLSPLPRRRSRKRTYGYVLRSMQTLRFLLITRAGRLTRIGGRNVLRLAQNPATEALYARIQHALAA